MYKLMLLGGLVCMLAFSQPTFAAGGNAPATGQEQAINPGSRPAMGPGKQRPCAAQNRPCRMDPTSPRPQMRMGKMSGAGDCTGPGAGNQPKPCQQR